MQKISGSHEVEAFAVIAVERSQQMVIALPKNAAGKVFFAGKPAGQMRIVPLYSQILARSRRPCAKTCMMRESSREELSEV